MHYQYIKIARRNLWKDRFYSLINISGLALAAAAFLLIIHYAMFEHSYENGYTKADNIYRVTLNFYNKGAFVVTDCETHPPAGPELKKLMPEVKDFVRLQNLRSNEVTTPEHKVFRIEQSYAADASVFSIFNYDFIRGNKASALKGPMDAVLTESTAQKLFGSGNPLGKTVKLRDQLLTVSAVIKDLPHNTHLKFDMLVSLHFVEKMGYNLALWSGNNNYTYLEMTPGLNLAAFNAKLKAFTQTRIKDRVMVAEPIKDIHLHSKKTFEPEANGDAKTVRFLLIIAFLILLISTINYVNLSTARSAERLKEAGVKKILGASRWVLIQQFFAESILINFIAFLLALLIVWISLPFYASITGIPISAGIFNTPALWATSILLFTVNCLLSGLYPSFALSSVKPVSTLNRTFTNNGSGGNLRKALVIGQFTVAFIVLAVAVIVYKQLQFMRNQDLGINLQETLVVKGINADSTSTQAFRNALLQLPGVKKVAGAGSMPGLPMAFLSSSIHVTRVGEENTGGYNYYLYSMDADFVPTMGIQLAAGENFSPGTANKNKLLINEEACRLLGFRSPEEAVGQKINLWGEQPVISGVLKNYHQRSLKDPLLPMIHWCATDNIDYYVLKVNTHAIRETVAAIEKTWKSHFSAHLFEYYFLDDMFNQQYKADIRFGQIVGIFSLFTIFITCLGLLGLTAYSVSRRTKEIAIRKVLGASISTIMRMLTKDFIRLVIAAILVATPIAWWAMHQWLEDYAYRIAIPWWVFVITGGMMLLVAVLTVGFQSLKAVMANPVKSLGRE
jgi:putative ABC transport system permease protein